MCQLVCFIHLVWSESFAFRTQRQQVGGRKEAYICSQASLVCTTHLSRANWFGCTAFLPASRAAAAWLSPQGVDGGPKVDRLLGQAAHKPADKQKLASPRGSWGPIECLVFAHDRASLRRPKLAGLHLPAWIARSKWRSRRIYSLSHWRQGAVGLNLSFYLSIGASTAATAAVAGWPGWSLPELLGARSLADSIWRKQATRAAQSQSGSGSHPVGDIRLELTRLRPTGSIVRTVRPTWIQFQWRPESGRTKRLLEGAQIAQGKAHRPHPLELAGRAKHRSGATCG